MIPRTRELACVAVICFVASFFVSAQSTHLRAADAKQHIGEKATVCGKVVSTRYAARTKGSPTFLNLDESYPHQIFTVLIWGSDRPKFGEPEYKYSNKKTCVTGLIKDYRAVPEIVVEEPSQVLVEK